MPTLDLKQITDKLNAEFIGDTRKIVFWYDDAAEFVDDIDTLEIIGANMHKLTATNQFSTKYLLERQDTESNYLVYAPFPKPEVRDNALEDIVLYSRRFYADRASLLTVDLSIDEKYKPIIQKYIKFFRETGRTQRFYDFEIESFNKETIEIALMSALCKTRTPSFEEVLRVVLMDSCQLSVIRSDEAGDDSGLSTLEGSNYLREFEKYDLLRAFWQMCEDSLGYTDADPSLLRLATTMFVTYAARQLVGDVPKAWKSFVSSKAGSIIAFLDNLMNSVIYKAQFDELAKHISSVLNVSENLGRADIDSILECDAFAVVDEFIIQWITERLLDEDIGATGSGMDILAICDLRMKKHFGTQYTAHYIILTAAYEIVCKVHYNCPEQFESILKQYITSDYRIDSSYRCFYTAYDSYQSSAVSCQEEFRNPLYRETESLLESLRERVENIYTNKYLNVLLPAFSSALDVKSTMRDDDAQLQFFDRKIKFAKDKTVVIISDALRYEIGQELFEKLNSDPNCNAEIKHMIGVLPAYTALGMAALLPHKDVQVKADGNVLVDGRLSDSTERRETILQATLPNTRCVSYDRLPTKRDEMREIFTGMDAVYVYHDQIDNKGSSSEDDVFAACSMAVDEIFGIIKRLSGSANVYRFVITADHGFLYKRDKFTESEKVDSSQFSGLSSQNEGQSGVIRNRRYIIAPHLTTDNHQLTTNNIDGVTSAPLSGVIGGEDARMVYWPIGANVFKTHGGLNYVHGGASPQEMILPLITVKTERGHVDTQPAEIALVSMVRKVTNLITRLDFIQKESVSDVVVPATYRLCFVSEENERISNEQIYQADRKDTDPNKRMFRLKFSFKNQKYDSAMQYWLVAVDDKSGVERLRHQVIMDIAFADGIGFDI